MTVLSTGLLLERHAAAIAANVDDLIVSLDGPPDTHDRIRRVPGAFEKLARGVRSIRALDPDFPVSARCTVQRANHAELRARSRSDARGGPQRDFVSCCRSHIDGLQPAPRVAREPAVFGGSRDGGVSTLEAEIESLARENQCGGFVAKARRSCGESFVISEPTWASTKPSRPSVMRRGCPSWSRPMGSFARAFSIGLSERTHALNTRKTC